MIGDLQAANLFTDASSKAIQTKNQQNTLNNIVLLDDTTINTNITAFENKLQNINRNIGYNHLGTATFTYGGGDGGSFDHDTFLHTYTRQTTGSKLVMTISFDFEDTSFSNGGEYYLLIPVWGSSSTSAAPLQSLSLNFKSPGTKNQFVYTRVVNTDTSNDLDINVKITWYKTNAGTGSLTLSNVSYKIQEFV